MMVVLQPRLRSSQLSSTNCWDRRQLRHAWQQIGYRSGGKAAARRAERVRSYMPGQFSVVEAGDGRFMHSGRKAERWPQNVWKMHGVPSPPGQIHERLCKRGAYG
mmetsp:Transcript_88615/g.259013  ORF Transcript_88615/g.259013 Transcript_88615/m.259013 type:complete len:105 (-) Transcript_88615:501-815(-)